MESNNKCIIEGKNILRRKSLLQPSVYKGCRKGDLRNEIPGRGRKRFGEIAAEKTVPDLRNEIPGRGRKPDLRILEVTPVPSAFKK